MQKITDIYNKYKIMPNLQDHMFRVAGVASLICDNFNELLPKREIVSACLLHDMGNIIKFNLDKFPEFLKPEGLDYWKNIQNEYFNKYGKEQHVATNKIIKELGVSDEVFYLVENIGFGKAYDNFKSDSFARKICAYSDMRVAPFGVESLEGRLEDFRGRSRGSSIYKDSEVEDIHNYFFEIEKQIFTKCKIRPENINNETILQIITELKNESIVPRISELKNSGIK